MSTPNELVYLIKAGIFYKIGKSTHKAFENRLADIQCGNPQRIEIIKTISVHDSLLSEGVMHDLYKAQRRRGEWFIFSEVELERVMIDMDRLELKSTSIKVESGTEYKDIDHLWEKAVALLITTCEENHYNPNWVYYRLEKLKPSQLAWDIYAEWRSYKPGWSYIQFTKQDEVLLPPTQKKMILGLSSTRISRERQAERTVQRKKLGNNVIKDSSRPQISSKRLKE